MYVLLRGRYGLEAMVHKHGVVFLWKFRYAWNMRKQGQGKLDIVFSLIEEFGKRKVKVQGQEGCS